MKNDKIVNRLIQNSKKNVSWIDKAKYRKENKAWLDLSFEIAIHIGSVLRSNKIYGLKPSNQKELASILDTSPQYVSKIMKGSEKLNIETITKLEDALDVSLIEVKKHTPIREHNVTVTENEVPREYTQVFENLLDESILNDFVTKEEINNSGEYNNVSYVQCGENNYQLAA